MNEVKWIKLDTALFDNRKIKMIRTLPDGDSLVVIWLQLLLLAGKINDSGIIYLTKEIPYTEQMLSAAFDEPVSTIQLALETFKKFEMLEIIDDIIYISNWEKYQAIDKLEKIREDTRKRVASYRSKQKKIGCNVTCNADVTQCNAKEEEKEIEEEIDIEYSFLRKKENKKIYDNVKTLIESELLKRQLTNIEEEDLAKMVNEYEEKDIVYGIREAVIYEKPSVSYVMAVAKKRSKDA